MPAPILEEDLADSLGFPRSVLQQHRKALTAGEHFTRQGHRIAWTSSGLASLQGILPELSQKIAALAESTSLPAGEPAAPPPSVIPPPRQTPAPCELVSEGTLLNPQRLHCHKKNGGAPVLLRTHRPELFPSGFEFPAHPSDDPELFDPINLPRFPGRW